MKKLGLVLSGILLWQVTSAPLVRAVEIPPAERMRREIGVILEDSRFKYTDYWSELQKLFGRLNPLFKKKPSFGFFPNISDNVALRIAGVIVFVGTGLILVIYLAKVFRRERSLGIHNDIDLESREPIPSQLRDLAQGCAIRANYREAIRYLYRAALHQLAVKQWIPDGMALSDSEYLLLIRGRLGEDHPCYLAFRRLLSRFQAGWYGRKDCDALDYQEATVDLETVSRGAAIHG